MMKIRHTQTGVEQDISRYEWEVKDDFFKTIWQVLEEGDPVMLMEYNKDTGEHKKLWQADRDHAERMIKMNPDVYYYEEIPKTVQTPMRALFNLPPTEWAISKICDFYMANHNFGRSFQNLEQVLKMAGVKLTESDFAILVDILPNVGLFTTQDWGSKNGPGLGIKLAPGAITTLQQYSGYYKYFKRIKMNDVEMVDLIFEVLKKKHSGELSQILTDNDIEFDNNSIRRVRALLKSSTLAEVEEINVQGGFDASITINGKGLEELSNRSYSKYKEEEKLKQRNPIQNNIHISGNVTNSPIGQGRDLNQDFTNAEFHHKQNTYPKSPERIDSSIGSKIVSFFNHQVVGGLAVAAILALLAWIGKTLGWW